MNCQICKKDEVIWSGVDAFMLGVPTESVCYDCANTYALVSALNDKIHGTNDAKAIW